MNAADILELAKAHGDLTHDRRGREEWCFDDHGLLAFARAIEDRCTWLSFPSRDEAMADAYRETK